MSEKVITLQLGKTNFEPKFPCHVLHVTLSKLYYLRALVSLTVKWEAQYIFPTRTGQLPKQVMDCKALYRSDIAGDHSLSCLSGQGHSPCCLHSLDTEGLPE